MSPREKWKTSEGWALLSENIPNAAFAAGYLSTEYEVITPPPFPSYSTFLLRNMSSEIVWIHCRWAKNTKISALQAAERRDSSKLHQGVRYYYGLILFKTDICHQ